MNESNSNLYSLIESLNSLSNSNLKNIPVDKKDNIDMEQDDPLPSIETKVFNVPAFTFLNNNKRNFAEEKAQTETNQIPFIENYVIDIDINDVKDSEMAIKLKNLKEMKKRLNNNEVDSSLLTSIKNNILINVNEDLEINKFQNENIDEENQAEKASNLSETEDDFEYIQWEQRRINQSQGRKLNEKKEFKTSNNNYILNRLNEISEVFKEYDYEVQSTKPFHHHTQINFQEKQEYKYESMNEKYNNYTNQLSQVLDNINTLNDKSKYLKEKLKFYLTQDNLIQNEFLSVNKLSSDDFQEKNNVFYLSD